MLEFRLQRLVGYAHVLTLEGDRAPRLIGTARLDTSRARKRVIKVIGALQMHSMVSNVCDIKHRLRSQLLLNPKAVVLVLSYGEVGPGRQEIGICKCRA